MIFHNRLRNPIFTYCLWHHYALSCHRFLYLKTHIWEATAGLQVSQKQPFFCLVTAKILTGLPNFSLILLKPTQYCPAREATSQSPLSQLSIVVALVPTQGELSPRKGFLALLFTSCTAPYLTLFPPDSKPSPFDRTHSAPPSLARPHLPWILSAHL